MGRVPPMCVRLLINYVICSSMKYYYNRISFLGRNMCARFLRFTLMTTGPQDKPRPALWHYAPYGRPAPPLWTVRLCSPAPRSPCGSVPASPALPVLGPARFTCLSFYPLLILSGMAFLSPAPWGLTGLVCFPTQRARPCKFSSASPWKIAVQTTLLLDRVS